MSCMKSAARQRQYSSWAGLFLGIAALLWARYTVSSPLCEIDSFGSNPGHLRMFFHIPPGLPENAPLVVVAHGCFQTAKDVADNSGWVEIADIHKFALLFPQTSTTNEPTGGCFRTWEPKHQHRGAGEPLSIRQMIVWALKHHRLDRRRVFITGMSSGGLLTSVMLVTYPELFAAGAPQSAYPYKCATAFEDLKPCAAGERKLTPHAWGELARSGYPGYSGPRPRISIWHGAADSLIMPMNLVFQMEQWTDLMGIEQIADEEKVIAGHVRKRYWDGAGHQMLETYMVRGMGHAVAVDPDGTPECGVAAPFFADADICAALWIARWFGIAR
jgi:poly(hydroxyalkanoate) depolymerase family esterase